MKILIIDNDEDNYNKIKKITTKVFKDADIDYKLTSYSGLVLLHILCITKNFDSYDLVICNNLLPIFKEFNTNNIDPYGEYMINDINKMGYKNIPIIIHSFDDIEVSIGKNKEIYYLDEYSGNIFKTVLKNTKSKLDIKSKNNKTKKLSLY